MMEHHFLIGMLAGVIGASLALSFLHKKTVVALHEDTKKVIHELAEHAKASLQDLSDHLRK